MRLCPKYIIDKDSSKKVVCFTLACVHITQRSSIPHLNTAAAAVASSIVVVGASTTVVTAYLLCQQTAALSYCEVLANPSTHSQNPLSLMVQPLSVVPIPPWDGWLTD